MADIKYLGDLSSIDSDLVTVDNIAVVSLLKEIDQDLQYYSENNARFFAPLIENTSIPSKVVTYYDGEDLQPYAEGARPTSKATTYSYTQEVPFEEFQAALSLTTRAVQTMTAQEIAGFVQAKLAAFQKARFNALRQCIFSNQSRVVVDSLRKYQTTSLPLFNSDTSTDAPPVPGVVWQAGDLQHFNGRAGASLAEADIRAKLIDKVRKHGYKQIEIWANDFDYSIENLAKFVPADNQIGRDLTVASANGTGDRMRQLSPWEGLVGFIYNTPVIKTPIVPNGYAVAVGLDGGAGKSAFLSRMHPIPGLDGLQLDIKAGFPLESTIMTDGWGYAINHRGSCAVLKMDATTYATPTL